MSYNKRKRIFDRIERSKRGENVKIKKLNDYITFDNNTNMKDIVNSNAWKTSERVSAINKGIRNKLKYNKRYDFYVNDKNEVVYNWNSMDELYKGMEPSEVVYRNKKKQNFDGFLFIDKYNFGGWFKAKDYDDIPDNIILEQLKRQGGPIKPERGTKMSPYEYNWFKKDNLYHYQKYLDNFNDYKYEREKNIWNKYMKRFDKNYRRKRANEQRANALDNERKRKAEFAKESRRRAIFRRAEIEMNRAKQNNDNNKYREWSKRRVFYKTKEGMDSYESWKKVAASAKFKRDEAERNNNANDFEYYDNKWKAYNSLDKWNIDLHEQKFKKRIKDDWIKKMYSKGTNGIVIPRNYVRK